MNSSLIFWKSAAFTVHFVYVGFSKHSIVKTFLLIYMPSALFILCFHCSGCVAGSIVGRAAILPVRLPSTVLCRSATGTEPDFPFNPFPCWNRATRNRAPMLSPQLSWQPAPHMWTWSWSLYWGREDWHKEAGEAAAGRTGTGWTRDWKKVRGNLCLNTSDVPEKLSKVTWWETWSSHPLKITLKPHWHLLLLWRATSCLYYSFKWQKSGSSTCKLTFYQHITLENFLLGFI